MKKTIRYSIFLSFALFFSFIGALKVSANDSLFMFLENLNIGSNVSSEILEQGMLLENSDSFQKYAFESSWYSAPHILEIQNSTLTYLEIKIPPESVSEYRNLLSSLGEPEINKAKAESLRLVAFPSKGMGFIINDHSENDIRFIKFPKKALEDFEKEEGAGFTPVERTVDLETPKEGPTLRELEMRQNEKITLKKQISSFFTSVYFVWGGIGIILLTIFGGIIVFRRRRIQRSVATQLPH